MAKEGKEERKEGSDDDDEMRPFVSVKRARIVRLSLLRKMEEPMESFL